MFPGVCSCVILLINPLFVDMYSEEASDIFSECEAQKIHSEDLTWNTSSVPCTIIKVTLALNIYFKLGAEKIHSEDPTRNSRILSCTIIKATFALNIYFEREPQKIHSEFRNVHYTIIKVKFTLNIYSGRGSLKIRLGIPGTFPAQLLYHLLWRSAGTILHYVILHRRNTKSSDRSVPRASALMRMSFSSKHLCWETRTSWSELGWNGSFLQSCPSISVVFPGNYVALFSRSSPASLSEITSLFFFINTAHFMISWK